MGRNCLLSYNNSDAWVWLTASKTSILSPSPNSTVSTPHTLQEDERIRDEDTILTGSVNSKECFLTSVC